MTYCLIQKNEKNCNDCGEVIDGPYYTVDSGKVICEKDYKVSWYDIIVFSVIMCVCRNKLENVESADDLQRERF